MGKKDQRVDAEPHATSAAEGAPDSELVPNKPRHMDGALLSENDPNGTGPLSGVHTHVTLAPAVLHGQVVTGPSRAGGVHARERMAGRRCCSAEAAEANAARNNAAALICWGKGVVDEHPVQS